MAFSPNLEANINEASRLSLYLNSKLVLIHVGNASEEKLAKFKSLLKPYTSQGLQFEIVFKVGKPVEVILQSIIDSNIDLLLLGALKREKLVKYYLGSIARKITRKAKCSILLLTQPDVNRQLCKHIVVNGLDEEQTEKTITSAIYMAHKFGSKSVTIVEEISNQKLSVIVEDDVSLRKSNIEKAKIKRVEELRTDAILNKIPEDYKTNLKIKSQPIFGKSGYSIGHYTEVVRADLLVMNAPNKITLWDRIFPLDIKYILTELPSDVLIIR